MLGWRGFLRRGTLGVRFKEVVGVHKTRVKWDKLGVGVGDVVAGDGGLVVRAKPTRSEDFGGIHAVFGGRSRR